MTKPEIRTDIPIPTAHPPKTGRNIEFLRAMSPGDSAHWPLGEEEKALRFYRVAKKIRARVMIRKVGEEDPDGPGTRMWRLADEDNHG